MPSEQDWSEDRRVFAGGQVADLGPLSGEFIRLAESLLELPYDQREAVEGMNLCPFARRSREQGRVHRPLLYASEPAPADAAARALRDISREHPDVEVVLLTFVLPRAPDHPWHDVDAFEEVVKAVRGKKLFRQRG